MIIKPTRPLTIYEFDGKYYYPNKSLWEEFITGGGTFEELTDTPTYVGNELKGLRINALGTGVEAYVATDLNQWLVSGVAFVDPLNGTAGGVLGDGNQPFQTLNQALAVSNNVVALAGEYYGTTTIPAGTYNILFWQGAVLMSSSKIRDGGNTVDLTINGLLDVGAFSYGFEFTGVSSVGNIELKKFSPESRNICHILGASCNIYMKCDTAEANGNNGGGYPITVREGSEMTFEANKIVFDYWFVTPRGVGNKVTIKCPDITISAVGFAGGGFGKTLTNFQGTLCFDNHITFDFLGGVVTNLSPTQTATFGIADSTLIIKGSTQLNDPSTFTFKNGTIESGAVYGWNTFYIIRGGSNILTNLNIKSDTFAFRAYLGNTAASGSETFDITNCSFDSDRNIVIGSAKIIYFTGCSFKVTNPTDVRVFAFNTGNPQTPPSFYFTGCSLQLDAGAGESFAQMTPAVTLGCANTISSEVLGVGATDTWGGLTTIPTFQLPNK